MNKLRAIFQKGSSVDPNTRTTFYHGITFKLILILTLLVTILVFLTGAFLIIQEQRSIEKSVLESHLQIARGAESQLDLLIKQGVKVAEFTAQMPELQAMDRFNLSTIMHTMIKEHEMIESAVVINNYGREISSSEFRLKYKDRSRDSVFMDAMFYKKTQVSPVSISSVTRLPVFDVSVPIVKTWMDPDVVFGVLVVKVKLKSLWPVVEKIRLGQTGHAYVVDQDGCLIAHSLSSKRRSVADRESFLTREPVRRALKKSSGVGRFQDSAKGEQLECEPRLFNVFNLYSQSESNKNEFICAYVPLEIIQGGVIFQQSVDEVFSGLFEVRRQSFTFLWVSMGLAVLISLFIAGRITHPIRRLAIGTRLVSSGDLTYRIPSRRKDEIGVLANSFNVMTSALEKKIKDLNDLQNWSTRISSLLEKDELIRNIIQIFSGIAHSDKISLMILDENIKKLFIHAAENIPSEVIKNFHPDLGSGIAGIVAETGDTILIDDIQKDSRYISFSREEGHSKKESLLSIPLIVRGKTMGVINLSRIAPSPEFNQDDITLYNTLANNAAIAIQNAILYELAITDSLTHLYIRRYYQQRLSEELDRAIRYKTSLSLIMIDIDFFKNLNDSFGHQQGDLVLVALAELIKGSIRDTDIAARLGGEEFSIIIPGEEKEGVRAFAERLCQLVAQNEFSSTEGKVIHATISMGVTSLDAQEDSEKTLMRRADKALYQAKKEGRNKVCYL